MIQTTSLNRRLQALIDARAVAQQRVRTRTALERSCRLASIITQDFSPRGDRVRESIALAEARKAIAEADIT